MSIKSTPTSRPIKRTPTLAPKSIKHTPIPVQRRARTTINTNLFGKSNMEKKKQKQIASKSLNGMNS